MIHEAEPKLPEAISMCFQVGDGTALPYQSEVFDLVAICFSLRDVPHRVGIQLLNEALRVLKQNGNVLVVDYNEPAKALIARALPLIAMTYESPNYQPFVTRGFSDYLSETALDAC